MLNTDHNSKFLPEALTFDDILMVPAHLLRVAQAYGLAQVERMAKAGLL